MVDAGTQEIGNGLAAVRVAHMGDILNLRPVCQIGVDADIDGVMVSIRLQYLESFIHSVDDLIFSSAGS